MLHVRLCPARGGDSPACIGGYVGVYDGKEHAVSVDLKAGATAQFSIDGGKTWKTDAPAIKNVGKTTVDYKVTTLVLLTSRGR